MGIKYVCLIALISFNLLFAQKTYYVSSSSGNDANSGTTNSTPWKSISKLNSVAFMPGDKILFRCGDKFYDNFLTLTENGSESSRIYIGNYGTGNLPVIGDSLLASNLYVIRLEGSNITIDGLMVRAGTNTTRSSGIYVGGNNITIKNCKIGGGKESRRSLACVGINSIPYARNLDYDSNEIWGFATGIEHDGNGSERWSSTQYLYIRNNYVHHCYDVWYMSSSVRVIGVNTSISDYNYRVIVSGNEITKWGETAFDCAYAARLEFTKNHLHNPIISALPPIHNGDNGNSGNAIKYGEWRPDLTPYGSFGNRFTYNIIHDLWVPQWDNGNFYNNVFQAFQHGGTVAYNLIYNVYGAGLIISHKGVASPMDTCTWNVYNNTFITGSSTIQIWDGRTAGIYIRNNILESDNRVSGKSYRYSYPRNSTESSGIWHGTDSWSFTQPYDVRYQGWADFQKCYVDANILVTESNPYNQYSSAYLYSGKTKANKGTTDPLFVDKAGNDYTLKSASPAVDYGLDYHYSKDLSGNLISGNPDVGAFESSTITNQNSAPVINSTPIYAAVYSQLYTYDVNSSGNPAPTYSLSSAPAGMSINSSTGVIQWTPDAIGSFNVTVTAANSISPNASQSFVINVTGTAPSITSTAITNGSIGQLYTYDVNASGNPAPTYSLSVSPANMTINSSTGLIQWTPGVAGNYNVTVVSANGLNPSASQSFTITVIDNNNANGSISYPQGLLSYWNLDETSGTTYIDKVNSLNGNGVVPPVSVTGKVITSQRFNGSSTQVNVPANSAFNFGVNSNFSVEFWIKRPISAPLTSTEVAVGRYSGTDNFRWFVGIENGTGKGLFYLYSGGNSAYLNGYTVIADGNWHHIAATIEAASKRIRLYVDGKEDISMVTNFTTGFSSATANLNIGWLSANTSYTFEGDLDEAAIYNTTLSSTVIQQHYTNGMNGKIYFDIIANYITANLKIFLQGPYSNGIMNTSLKDYNQIPLKQPYNVSPWNYQGSEQVSSVPSDIVDWILVELRNGINSSNMVSRRAAFLKKDGSVVDTDGVSKLKFNNAVQNNYYVVIYHRNHLAAMSAVPIALSSTSELYDFTTASNKSYGSLAVADLGSNVYGLYAGDGDANGIVNILDYKLVSLNQNGYNSGDVDLNNINDFTDYSKIGSCIFRNTKVPQ